MYILSNVVSERAPPLRLGIPIHSPQRPTLAHALFLFRPKTTVYHQLESLVPHGALLHLLRYTSIPNAQVLFNQLDSGFTQLTEPIWKGILDKASPRNQHR